MAHLPTRSFQAHQVFAANTNVGKTILSTGLVRAAAALAIGAEKKRMKAFYLKPVQTGYPVDCDARHVKTYAPLVETSRLYAYPDPVSPHIATTEPPPDTEVLQATIKALRGFKQSLEHGDKGWALLETAGGVNSPIMSGELQSRFYRPLRLPTVLVGDSHLGGISTTLSSYESLHQYGYDIPAVLLFHNHSRNHEFLDKYLAKAENRPLVHVLPSPPEKLADPKADAEQLHEYYKRTESYFRDVVEDLDRAHQRRLDRLEELGEKARTKIWWPFTQHQTVKDVTIIDSAYGDIMTTYVEPSKNAMTATGDNNNSNNNSNKDNKDKEWRWREMFDGCASWWTQGLGHGSPELTRSAAYAAGRYGHVMFPECAHEPAVKLSETLLETVGQDWASRVFFSDNGSTAIEVALKMALKSTQDRYVHMGQNTNRRIEVIGIDGGYHGDTIGAMNACSPNAYNAQVSWYKSHGHWFTPPTVVYKDSTFQITIPQEMTADVRGGGGSAEQKTLKVTINNLSSVFAKPSESDPRLAIYRNHIRSTLTRLTKDENRQFGALLMEPVLMGAGGMVWVDPAFQRCLVEEVRAFKGFGTVEPSYEDKSQGPTHDWSGLPVVFDEVFSGCWRLGRKSAADMLQVKPDIAAYAKLLTGGLITLATTLTTEPIFNNFLSDTKTDALLHGHSYTAHPIGCAVANTSLQTYREMESHGDADQAREDWGALSHGSLGVWSLWDQKVVDRISRLEIVQGVVPLGSVLAIQLRETDGPSGYASMLSQRVQQKMREKGEQESETEVAIFGRPLGNVVYMIASQVSTREQLAKVENILLRTLEGPL